MSTHQEASEQMKRLLEELESCAYASNHKSDYGSARIDKDRAIPLLASFLAPPVAAPTESEADLRREISRLRAELTGADPITPTQKAVEAAREIHGAVTDLQNGLCAHITVEDFAAIIQRICFPDHHLDPDLAMKVRLCATDADGQALLSRHFHAPATATEGEDELAVLRETIKAIEAVNVNEFGGKADLAISRLIESIPQAIAARHTATQQEEQNK